MELYSGLLERAYTAAEQLHETGEDITDPQLRLGLAAALQRGGVSALVGHTYASDGDGGRVQTAEATRALAQLEAEERDRCARFAALALNAGIAERQVRLAEQQAHLIAGFAAALARRLGLDPTLPDVRAAIAAELRAVDAPTMSM